MTLDEYLTSSPLTESDFAHKIGVKQSTVNRLRRCGQIPKRNLMKRIVEETGGLVTANDFFQDAA